MNVTNAIIAVTLNCNSRCIMCDIWKNRIKDELLPEDYLKLPSTLTDINITGGEPFLRYDLPEIIKNIKTAAPRARLVLNTNGFLTNRISQMLKKILITDPNFGIRISLDGTKETHNKIRGIPNGYDKAMATLDMVRKLGVKDIGISFTLGNYNIEELPKIQKYCNKNKLEFSLTVVTDSVIYFGKDKQFLRPDNNNLSKILKTSAQTHTHSFSPKEIIRGWFVTRLSQYIKTKKRALPCDAGTGFFYMDSTGNIYTCHLKPWLMGNIRNEPINKILSNYSYQNQVRVCNDCWMVCTAKTAIMKNKGQVIYQCLLEKTSDILRTSFNN